MRRRAGRPSRVWWRKACGWCSNSATSATPLPLPAYGQPAGRILVDLADREEELALHDIVLAGVARLVTNPRIFADPAPMPVTLEFLARVRTARRARWLPPVDAAWTELERLAQQDRGLRANLVPDALSAALARAHGCRVATADRSFDRFPGVRSFDPAA